MGQGSAPVKASRALVYVLCTPGPACQLGMAHVVEIPPPAVPENSPWFHGISLGAGPRAWRVVPPTPVTQGSLAGSSTWRLVSRELGKM